MKIVALIQARMGSSRLPGKVLKPLGNKSVLGHVINRVHACPRLDEVVVATTSSKSDDIIVEESEKYKACWFRGSVQDVLARYYHGAKQYQADIIIRVTSDCPLYDPDILTRMLDEFLRYHERGKSLDYMSNRMKRTFPRGLDTEILTFKALAHAHREAYKLYEREHVTPYIYLHPEIFSLFNFSNEADQSHYRWTLDTPEDYQMFRAIYGALYKSGELFTTAEILKLLENRPEIAEINAHIVQKGLRD